jgi:hypothetical protein
MSAPLPFALRARFQRYIEEGFQSRCLQNRTGLRAVRKHVWAMEKDAACDFGDAFARLTCLLEDAAGLATEGQSSGLNASDPDPLEWCTWHCPADGWCRFE